MNSDALDFMNNQPFYKTDTEKIEEIAELLVEIRDKYCHNPYDYANFALVEKIITDNGANQQIMTRATNNYKKKQLQDQITKLQQELDELNQ